MSLLVRIAQVLAVASAGFALLQLPDRVPLTFTGALPGGLLALAVGVSAILACVGVERRRGALAAVGYASLGVGAALASGKSLGLAALLCALCWVASVESFLIQRRLGAEVSKPGTLSTYRRVALAPFLLTVGGSALAFLLPLLAAPLLPASLRESLDVRSTYAVLFAAALLAALLLVIVGVRAVFQPRQEVSP